MTRKKIKLSGYDIFLFAITDRKIKSYKDLHLRYVQSEQFSKLYADQNVSFSSLFRAIKTFILTEEKRKNIAEILAAEGYKLSREKDQVGTDVLRDLFKYRRAMGEPYEEEASSNADTTEGEDAQLHFDEDANASVDGAELKSCDDQTQPIKKVNCWKISNPEIEKTFNEFNPDIQGLLQEMAQSSLELERLISAYANARKSFHTMKESRQRDHVMWLIANTYVASMDEVATLLDIDVNRIKKMVNNKALKKKANMFFKRHASLRKEETKSDDTQENTKIMDFSETELDNSEFVDSTQGDSEVPEAEDSTACEAVQEDAEEEVPQAEESAVDEAVQKNAEEEILQTEECTAEDAVQEAEEEDVPKVEETQVEEAKQQISDFSGNNIGETSKKQYFKKSPTVVDIDEKQNSYRLRDGLYEWFSSIVAAANPSEILIDTNILMNPYLSRMIKNRFAKGYVSDVVIYELRKHLGDAKKDVSMKAFLDIARCVREGYFYVPIMDHDFDKRSDHDIKLIDTAKSMSLTFVTGDSGAKVYAWTIGCPCRYYRTAKPKAIVRGIAKSKTCVIDVGTNENDLLQFLHSKFGNVIITNEFAKKLNRRKFEVDYSVHITDLQQDIATDTTRFYFPHKMDKSYEAGKYEYEMELIELCKQKNAVLISSDATTIVRAWSYGVETCYYE